jgi:hypothetical protein
VTPHGVRALVGDVCGKGLDAVQTAAVTREAAYDERSLARVAERVDASTVTLLDPPDPWVPLGMSEYADGAPVPCAPRQKGEFADMPMSTGSQYRSRFMAASPAVRSGTPTCTCIPLISCSSTKRGAAACRARYRGVSVTGTGATDASGAVPQAAIRQPDFSAASPAAWRNRSR